MTAEAGQGATLIVNSIPQENTPLKQCTKCLKWFPSTEDFFQKHSRGGLQPRCKVCRNQENKKYRDAQPGYHKKYYREHKEKMLADAALYRIAHHEEILSWQKQYTQDHYEQYLVVQRVAQQKRYMRKNGIEGTLSVQEIQTKLEAQKCTCYYCLKQFKQRKDGTHIYHLDHVIPVSRTDLNPLHDVNNIVLACPLCNQRKSDRLPWEWPEGGRLL